MKLNLTKPLIDIDGQTIQFKKGVPATLKNIGKAALLNTLPGETPNGDTSYDRYCLAKRLADADEAIELKVEDVGTIKTCIGGTFGPAIVGPAFDLLENNSGD